MINAIRPRVWAWMRQLSGWILRPGQQRTAAWLFICVACVLFGMAAGFGLGVDYVSWLFGYDTITHDRRAFSIFSDIGIASGVPFLLGVWMLRHARRRERGLPPDPLTIFGSTVEQIRQIREMRREARRLAEEREKKKAIFDAWRNR